MVAYQTEQLAEERSSTYSRHDASIAEMVAALLEHDVATDRAMRLRACGQRPGYYCKLPRLCRICNARQVQAEQRWAKRSILPHLDRHAAWAVSYAVRKGSAAGEVEDLGAGSRLFWDTVDARDGAGFVRYLHLGDLGWDAHGLYIGPHLDGSFAGKLQEATGSASVLVERIRGGADGVLRLVNYASSQFGKPVDAAYRVQAVQALGYRRSKVTYGVFRHSA